MRESAPNHIRHWCISDGYRLCHEAHKLLDPSQEDMKNVRPCEYPMSTEP